MIKQSLLNKFAKKYVKAGIDEPEINVKKIEEIFHSLNDLFLSSLNKNEPGLSYGALRLLATRLKYTPFIEILKIKRDAEKDFLKGSTSKEKMLEAFLKMDKVFVDDIGVLSASKANEFYSWFVSNAKDLGTEMTGLANVEAAKVFWNKMAHLRSAFVSRTVDELGGIVPEMGKSHEQYESYSAGTVSTEITDLFKALGEPFVQYISDLGRDFALEVLRETDSSLAEFIAKSARQYARIFYKTDVTLLSSTGDKASKEGFILELKSQTEFKTCEKILKDNINKLKTKLIVSGLDAEEKSKAKEKSDSDGFKTDGHDKVFWTYLSYDTDLAFQIQTLFGTKPYDGSSRRDSCVAVLKAFKAKEPQLYRHFSMEAAACIRVPGSLTDEQKKAERANKVKEFTQSVIYTDSVKLMSSIFNKSSFEPKFTVEKKTDVADDLRKEAIKRFEEYKQMAAKCKSLVKKQELSNDPDLEKTRANYNKILGAIERGKSEIKKRFGVILE